MNPLFDPRRSVEIFMDDEYEPLLHKHHGCKDAARGAIAELWGLPADSRKINAEGFFVEPESVMDIRGEECRVVVQVAEASFQHWSMTYMRTLSSTHPFIMSPSIWKDSFHTSKANATWAGVGKVVSNLSNMLDDPDVVNPYRAKAEFFMEKLNGYDAIARGMQRDLEVHQEITADPRLHQFLGLTC